MAFSLVNLLFANIYRAVRQAPDSLLSFNNKQAQNFARSIVLNLAGVQSSISGRSNAIHVPGVR